MAPQPVQSKSTSRWGSLLQQAVAGVESRLDTILADDDKPNTAVLTRESAEQLEKKEGMNMPAGRKLDTDLSRRGSLTKKSDRLQERLTKVVVNRNNTKSSSPSGLPSRAASPSQMLTGRHESLESMKSRATLVSNGTTVEVQMAQDHTDIAQATDPDDIPQDTDPFPKAEVHSSPALEVPSLLPQLLSDSHESDSGRPSMDSSQCGSDSVSVVNSGIMGERSVAIEAQPEEVIAQMRSDYETAELHRQEETHRYLEHIDVLQAKLQYLTKEAIVIANKARSEAVTGSTEDKLAMKDEKIALLMDEGQSLSQTELKHMSMIRKLRAKSIGYEKSLKQGIKSAAELEKAVKSAQERVKEAEASQREDSERCRALQKLEEQVDKIKLENGKKDSKILDLQKQIVEAQNAKEANEVLDLRRLLEAERKAVLELRDDLSNAKVEKDLCEERLLARCRELQEKAARDRERVGVTEMELRGEIGVLETRLESLRNRAEDFSSGSSNITHSKLLRQIETLQTQYTVASENWRGIEGSLLVRISNLETERDDVMKREGDIRRKARMTGNKCRRLEDETEQSTGRVQELEQQVSQQAVRLVVVHEAQAAAELEVMSVSKELQHEKEHWQARLDEQLEIERRELHPHPPENYSPQLRTEIPALSNRQRGRADKASPHPRRYQVGSGLGLAGAATPLPDRPVTRRNSGQPLQFSGTGTPHRQDSLASTPQASVYNGIPETPSVQTDNQDEFFDGVITPATPERTINDMVSASTAAAGPSVQLVERMSAAVRRLESEKAASRDELDRLSAQRDEAREEAVALMREAEGKRTADSKISKLEIDMVEMNQRYQTTLEMLGEKSELVEELQADITDVKQMYKDLVNSTMR